MGPERRGLALLVRSTHVEASLWRRLRLERQGGCREALFDRHRGMALALAKREFHRRPAYGLEQADCEHLALGGLLEAIDKFDPLLGPPFSAFAKFRIKGAITEGLAASSEKAAQYTYRRRLELERLRSLDADPSQPPRDPIAALGDLAAALAIGLIAEGAGAMQSPHEPHSPYEGHAWRDLQISVAQEIARLPETECTVMRQHYLHNVPFAQIAALLSLTKGRVSQLHRAALMKLRQRLRRSD